MLPKPAAALVQKAAVQKSQTLQEGDVLIGYGSYVWNVFCAFDSDLFWQ